MKRVLIVDDAASFIVKPYKEDFVVKQLLKFK